MSTLLKLKNIEKTYTSRGAQPVHALTNISFTIEAGEFVAIMGESGSGKSTLLNLIATLDDPTGGDISLNGQDLSNVKEGTRAKLRREHLGFIFQDFDLLDTFNVQDNIFLPLVLAKKPLEIMRNRLTKLAPRLGIDALLKKYPYELSGGQQQRVAAARAMITEPEILLADEPTGALDSKTSTELLDLLTDVNAENRQTILMVTHSAVAASHSRRVLFIRDGQIFHQLYRGDLDQPSFLTRISETMTAMLTKAGDGQ